MEKLQTKAGRNGMRKPLIHPKYLRESITLEMIKLPVENLSL
jgi:hypothetical protein